MSTSVDTLSPSYSQLHAATSKDDHHANEQYCNKNNAKVREMFKFNKTVTNQILILHIIKDNGYNFIKEIEKYNSNHSFTLLNEKPVEHILKDHQEVILSCNFGGNSGEYLASTIDARKVRL